jgi:hypothetical protein
VPDNWPELAEQGGKARWSLPRIGHFDRDNQDRMPDCDGCHSAAGRRLFIDCEQGTLRCIRIHSRQMGAA